MAVIDTGVDLLTPPVVIVNEADFCPEATVIDEGTVAATFPLERATVRPPDPAGPLKLTVPVVEVPLTTEEDKTIKETNVGGLIVKGALTDTPLSVADI